MIFRFHLVLSIVLVAGCASASDDTNETTIQQGWPSLAPRVGEVSPLVPRVPLGVCAGCSPDAVATVAASLPTMTDLPAPVRSVLPSDIEKRLASIETTIATIENEWPGLRNAARTAIASATPGAIETEADVQASRFEALFQPLGLEDAALSALEALLPDVENADAYSNRVAALRARLGVLDVIRAKGLSE